MTVKLAPARGPAVRLGVTPSSAVAFSQLVDSLGSRV